MNNQYLQETEITVRINRFKYRIMNGIIINLQRGSTRHQMLDQWISVLSRVQEADDRTW